MNYDSSTSSGNFVEDWINSWTHVDLSQTITAFIGQTNRKTYEGPIGFLYFAEPILPFVSRPCERVHLTCELGMGLELALFYTIVGLLIYVAIIYNFFPSISGFVQIIIVSFACGGSLVFGLSMITARTAWGYEAKCYLPQDNTLLKYGLGLSWLPLYPQCAFPEVNRIMQKYLITQTPLASFDSLGLLDLLLSPSKTEYLQPGGYTCPNKVIIQNCYNYGITSLDTLLGMTLVRYAPSVATWLKYSCLVRGGCGQQFFLSTPDPSLTNDGWLAGLFTGYNDTAFRDNADPILNHCYWFNMWALGIVLIFLYVTWPILIAVFNLAIDLIKLTTLIFISIFTQCQYEDDVQLERESAQFMGNY